MTIFDVKGANKDSDGDIVALCGSNFSLTEVKVVIDHIESRNHEYKIGNEVVIVVNDPDGKYLRAPADQSKANNLDSLPACK